MGFVLWRLDLQWKSYGFSKFFMSYKNYKNYFYLHFGCDNGTGHSNIIYLNEEVIKLWQKYNCSNNTRRTKVNQPNTGL